MASSDQSCLTEGPSDALLQNYKAQITSLQIDLNENKCALLELDRTLNPLSTMLHQETENVKSFMNEFGIAQTKKTKDTYLNRILNECQTI